MVSKSPPQLTVKQIIDNTPEGIDPWLTPDAVAQMCGLSLGWLADAREGRKGINGPKHIKIGTGRTATIRYRISAIIAWMSSFEERESTLHRVSPYSSSRSWVNDRTGKPSDRWPFIITEVGIRDLFLSMRIAVDAGTAISEVRWMTRAEYKTGRYIKKQISLSQNTLAKLLASGDGDLAQGLENLLR